MDFVDFEDRCVVLLPTVQYPTIDGEEEVFAWDAFHAIFTTKAMRLADAFYFKTTWHIYSSQVLVPIFLLA